MTCGIYLGSPKNIILDRVYIGQSIDIEKRVQRHNLDLRKGKHSPKMLEAYTRYGEFSWEIIEECSIDNLDTREEYYISLFNAVTQGFNTLDSYKDAPRLSGTSNGMVKLYRLPEYLNILKYTLKYPDYSKVKIAELTNTTPNIVSDLWHGVAYTWLEDIEPEAYRLVRKLSGSRYIGGKTALQQGIVYPPILNPDFEEFNVSNAREFARVHSLDKADFSNMLNMKVASVKGWIVKDLDIINPEAHARFISSNRGHYKKQFTLYKSIKGGGG